MIPVSNDTLLRVVRRYGKPPMTPPNVVGIDDWAWRRNFRYGTIVCDLERRRTIARLMTIGRDDLTKAETVTMAAIETSVPLLVEAREIVIAFQSMIRRRCATELSPVEFENAAMLA